MKPRSLRMTSSLTTLLISAAMMTLTGCTAHYPTAAIRPAPAAAEKYYADAHSVYLRALEQPTRGEAHAAAMNEAVKRLEAAIAHQAPRAGQFVAPIFTSRLGELLLDLSHGRDRELMNRAFAALERSVQAPDGCPEWVPGWLGLARWAALSAQPTRASEYLERGTIELNLLEKRYAHRPQMSPLLEADRLSPSDLPDDERMRLLLEWMEINEKWLDRDIVSFPAAGAVDPMLTEHASSGATARPREIDLARRLRARIAFGEAELALARGADASKMMELLDAARRYDGDYFPLELEYAAQLRRAGKPQDAERFIHPFLERSDVSPAFRRNARLWLEAARIYSDWYAQEPSAAMAVNAERAFGRILDPHGLDPESAEAYVEFARFYQRVAAHADPSARASACAAARECLQNANQLKADARAIQSVEADLAGMVASR